MAHEKIKVLLTERIAGIGKQGEIIEVSYSQAKNYLIPKGLAKLATEGVIAEKEKKAETDRKRKMELAERRYELEKILRESKMEFQLPGKNGKVFGGIGEHEIIERLKKEHSVHLERKHVHLPGGHHLKEVGEFPVRIDLGSDTFVRLNVCVSVKE